MGLKQSSDFFYGLSSGFRDAHESKEPEKHQQHREDAENPAADQVGQGQVRDAHQKVTRPVDQSGHADGRAPALVGEYLAGYEPRDAAGSRLEEHDEQHDGDYGGYGRRLARLAVLQGYGENESAARYSSQAEQVQEPPAGFFHQRDGDGAEDDVHRAQAARQRLTRSCAHPGLLEHLAAEIEHRVDARELLRQLHYHCDNQSGT